MVGREWPANSDLWDEPVYALTAKRIGLCFEAVVNRCSKRIMKVWRILSALGVGVVVRRGNKWAFPLLESLPRRLCHISFRRGAAKGGTTGSEEVCHLCMQDPAPVSLLTFDGLAPMLELFVVIAFSPRMIFGGIFLACCLETSTARSATGTEPVTELHSFARRKTCDYFQRYHRKSWGLVKNLRRESSVDFVSGF